MNIRDKKEILILCPHCGAEYLPAEIFIPSNFFGKPEDIDKDNEGKLEAYDGTPMDLKEDFICDKCGKEFEIIADIRFKSQLKSKEDFNEIYTSPLYPNKISLFEGNLDDSDN